MEIMKASELKMVAGKPIVLAIPPCMNAADALSYYNSDHTIVAVLECIHSYDQGITAYHNMMGYCFDTKKYGVLMISTGDVGIISNIAKAVGYTYMLVPAGWDAGRVNAPENVPLLTTNGSTMKDVIQEMWGYVRFPVFSEMAQHRLNRDISAFVVEQFNGRPLQVDTTNICLDNEGRAILRTVDPVVDLSTPEGKEKFSEEFGVSLRETEYMAYVGSDFVTLSKKDARAIADLLDKVVEESGGDDVKAFGEKGISYERLHDRLTGLLYNSAIEANFKKEESSNV